MKRVVLLVAALSLHLLPRAAGAQTTRPWLEWRTVATKHFDVHYPAELEAWARDAASRLDAIHAAVGPLVGSTPAKRVTVVVDDPAGETNGSAYSFLRTPYINLYPTPPDARSSLANTRNYTEQLAIHEFAHVAHLTRPSRRRVLLRGLTLDPRGMGPIPQQAPRWVREGYATYVEGRLTGSGRPYSAIRAAVLRQWALEGRIPPYGQLDALTGGYQAGGMAYLAGSAFLEWLAARRGDETLVHLWRRMSARQARPFAEAFRGVYGGTPQELYGLFTVELTANALEARRRLVAEGLVTGDTVQHLAWHTGDPAVSPGGEHVAITLRGPTPAWNRVVVWAAEESPDDSAAIAARARLLQRDSQDVAAIQVWPRPRRALATLGVAEGDLAYSAPRFLPGGDEMLVIRAARAGGGVMRPDLFVWNWRKHTVRRVTHGAAIRAADPAPDGRRAVAVQCLQGYCGLVWLDLRSGALATLAEGTSERVFDHPRFSPDGRTVAAAMQEGGRWKIVAVDSAGVVRVLFDDVGASTYDPVFTADGQALVVVSEAGGIPNLWRVPLSGADPAPLTRVTGMAVGPDVDRATGAVYFLNLHSGGLDLHRLHPDSVPAITPVQLPASLAPAVQRVADVRPDTLARAALPASRPYGIGPRWTRVLPWGAATTDGGAAGVAFHDVDPVGRLSLLARAAYGSAGMERGAAASAVWRGTRPSLGAEAFYVDHRPSRLGGYAGRAADAAYFGGVVSAQNAWGLGRRREAWRLGASAGRLDLVEGDAGSRVMAFGGYDLSVGRRRGPAYSSGQVSVSAAAGRTAGGGWRRGRVTGALGVGSGLLGIRVEGTLARVNESAPAWERFTVGGTGPLLVDDRVLGQRMPMPALGWGALEGTHVATYRVSTVMSGLTPYLWGGTTDPGLEGWVRVAGVELSTGFPSLRAGAVPNAQAIFGVAYGLEGAREKEFTAYAGLTYTP